MTSIEFERPDCVEFIRLLSDSFKAKLSGNLIVVPPAIGSGYIWAEKLPLGMEVLVANVVMKHELAYTMFVNSHQYFNLQFNEYEADLKKLNHTAVKYVQQFQSAVKISNTASPQTLVFPEGVNLLTVRFFFNKEQLGQLMGNDAMEEVLTKYFPYLLKQDNLEPLATRYRETLNDLLVDKFESPLRLNFIQNRVFLLLEKFVIQLSSRKDITTTKEKRTYDETLRLIHIESLLVKNFLLPAPTIDELSRISAMSPTKLKNDFKRMYGIPIYSYRQKNRMLKAKSLLLMSKYTIQEVGRMVGFTNLSHFAKAFKKEFKILPSELSAKDGVLIYNT